MSQKPATPSIIGNAVACVINITFTRILRLMVFMMVLRMALDQTQYIVQRFTQTKYIAFLLSI